ncbi:hypothetical protein [Rothia nasimurium]|uniref:hypothetical protein n=1 Tax=Rothia nasimurium TaxID=85336 RepID=UPI001F21126D|nr:hypothetical protein [Rothia nasimurium]
MTSLDQQGLQTSRRGLMRFAALTGVAGVATAAGTAAINATAHAADATASVFPSDFSYPTVTGPSLALWGSSSFDGAHADQGVPAGFDASPRALLSSYLSAPVLEFGRGGDTSSLITARRGTSHYRCHLIFPNDKIPASGQVNVTLAGESLMSWGSSLQLPCYVGAVPGVLSAGASEGQYVFTRAVAGDEIYAPPINGATVVQSYQEMISRTSYHVIQIGRNNLNQPQQIKDDTQRAYDMAPERTIVLGHFRGQHDGNDSTMAKQVNDYNAWAAQTYGVRFMNPETYLRETTQESWLRYGALAGSGVWSSDDDRKAYDEGKIPATLYAADGFHLNGWGYVALSQMIYYKVTELGWF